MRAIVLRVVRFGLMAVGALVLVAVAAVVILARYESAKYHQRAAASEEQLLVEQLRSQGLAWTGAPRTGRSFDSPQCCARIVEVRLGDRLAAPTEAQGWHRGDTLPVHARDALAKASEWADGADARWFPVKSELTTPRYYVRVHDMSYSDDDVSSIVLTIVHPADGTAYVTRYQYED
jgi:hypothetical protein